MKREEGYSYIGHLRTLYIPRTPSAALQAVGEEILPIEAYIYKSTALNPILKKPYNLDEIEWLLARKNRDLQTNLILKSVLGELSRSEDKEIALFAAESLNAIEKEYNNDLTILKNRIKKENRREDRSRAAEIYYHMALLNKDESTLSNFYLKEAYQILENLNSEFPGSGKDNTLLVRILLQLKLYKQAEQMLPEGNKNRLLKLEIAYLKKDTLDEIREDSEPGEDEKEVLTFWTGNHGD